MKKSIFLGIIAIIFMLFLPANAICDPAGPPGGMDVKIVNQPVEVTGDVNANVRGDVNVVNNNDNPVPVTGYVVIEPPILEAVQARAAVGSTNNGFAKNIYTVPDCQWQ